jgi:hypothetical protein
MNSKLIFSFVALFCVVFISSCKKDKDNPVPGPTPTTPAAPTALLTVGNYWVYDAVYFDEMGNETSNNDFDSTYIEKDTLINGNKWVKQVSAGISNGNNFKYIYFLRDSAGILVNNYGVKILDRYKTPGVIDNLLYLNGTDTLYKAAVTLSAQDTFVVLPAGSFTVKNVKTLYNIYINPPANRYKESIMLYHEKWGITIFSSSFYLSAPKQAHFEKRLVRYNVK